MRKPWLDPRQGALVIALGLACGRATYAVPAAKTVGP